MKLPLPTSFSSGFFGIEQTNREPDDHWSKNCFNSSFPTALACYLLAQKKEILYNKLIFENGKPKVITTTLPVNVVFGCSHTDLAKLAFYFESSFHTYEKYVHKHDEIEKVDLVVKEKDGKDLRALEIKLTVMPDNTTVDKEKVDWGCELVVRAATTGYMALGMYDALRKKKKEIFECFDPVCSSIQSWNNQSELQQKVEEIIACINLFERDNYENQIPLLMQPMWKTNGKSSEISVDAFDILVWSDYAFSRMFLDRALISKKSLSRPARAAIRMARTLWDLSRSSTSKIHLKSLLREMSLDKQTDKEFSLPGSQWRTMVEHERLQNFIVKREELSSIIDVSKKEKLSPERRLDQSLYFSLLK